MPIPKLDTPEKKAIASEIADYVRRMLDVPVMGGEVDNRIEALLRRLWGLEPFEGAYINGTFSLIPETQYVKDLFPNGGPPYVALSKLSGVAMENLGAAPGAVEKPAKSRDRKRSRD